MKNIYIEENFSATYPNNDYIYNPSFEYPEYMFNNISNIKNDIYDMIRNCFIGLKLDESNIGKSTWDPLKNYVKPGNNVVIKPNFVKDFNYNEQSNLDCLVTHPSVLRPIIDYCLIALKGTGSITIADAPVENCDFDKLIEKNHIKDLIDFYATKGINIKLCDLRLSGSCYEKTNKYGISSIDVDLGKNSLFSTLTKKQIKKLRITNFKVSDMHKYHNEKNHIYCISDVILNADVIINVPKPKTHKKGGVTISLKNMFGCIAKKECLPHHSFGSKKSGGDEYDKKSLIKYLLAKLSEKEDNYFVKHNKKSKILTFIKKCLYFLKTHFSKCTPETEGSWHGNETLYKTILDINRIIVHADKNGKLCDKPQRKMLIVADMIVSGEGNGPLSPIAKPLGIIAVGDNQINFDKVIATIMGFDINKIPTIKNSEKIDTYKLPTSLFIINSNIEKLNNKTNLNLDYNLNFTPADNWKGYIEINKK